MVSASSSVLITGGLGYLGGRIATYLLTAAPELRLRLTTRRTDSRIPEWAKRLDVVHADVLDQTGLKAALGGIDTVIHLAAINEVDSQKDPHLALDVNGRGTQHLLELSRLQEIRRFIYFSTFHVYGPTAAPPITEETPTRPVHPYAITHRLAEDFVNWYRHAYGMETLVLRLSNGYGYPADPWVNRWSLVFNDLCMQAVQRGEIKLRSPGTQQRDFASLTDIARGVLHFLNLPSAQWEDGLFNFGGNCSMSILQVAERVASEFSKRFGKTVPVIPGQAADHQVIGPVAYSIEKLTRSGFSLKNNMSEEIQKTFETCAQVIHLRSNG